MKKLSKIFAVVLCLVMVLSMLPMGAAAAAETITYDFSGLNEKSNTAIDAATAKQIFDAAASATGLTDVTTATKIYKGNDNSSGAFPYATDCLKTGTSGTAGKLVLKFNKNVTKVEIVCHAWKTSGATDKVSVNGAADQAAPSTGNKTTALTFDLATASDTVTIDLKNRVFIFKITVTLGGTAGGGGNPGGGTVTPPPAANEGTIAQVLAGAADSLWKTTGAINLIEGQNVYIQDATAAICVRLSAAPTDLAIGDNITVEGTLGEYKKLPQLNVDAAKCVKVAKTITFTPKAVTIATLDKADLCKAVKLTNVTITEIFDNNGQYTNPNITVSDGTNTVQIYKAVAPTGLAVGDKVDVVASLSCYNDTLQLRNDEATDIVKSTTTGGGDTTGGDTTGGDNTNKDPDKVGDDTAIVAMTSVMVIAVAALAVLVVGKKRMF